MKRYFKYWFIALLWMALIFDLSTGLGSPQHSSRLIVPILRWFKPNITYRQIDDANLVVRKCAHITEYAILAVLLCFAFRKTAREKIHGWCWRSAGFALILAASYGAIDEFHQIFVPSRGPSVRDVLIDTAGAAVGLFILWANLKVDPKKMTKPSATSTELAR